MDLRDGRMVLYRGSLKSCNYQCSYCPFSKHSRSERELLRDREQWIRFCGSLAHRAEGLNIRAVMVVPYGEALIHPWYWEGLGRLAAMDIIDGVGAQTNLSFSVEKSLEIYEHAGGDTEKLKLWATFHPEMTSVKEFGQRCRMLYRKGITVSAGAVGIAENLERLKELRRELPEEIYLWINKMDGLGRKYTEEEIAAFGVIDPCFERELELISADTRMCGNRLFVEGDGKMRRCNISRVMAENWYGAWEKAFDEPAGETAKCGKRICSCYLAYGGRDEVMNRALFGPYPLFRVPRKPKALFLDIDGTLIPEGEKRIPKKVITDIRILASCGCRLFFATSLPRKAAWNKCEEVWHLFEGGIFAGGACVVLETQGKRLEHVVPVEGIQIPTLERLKKKYRFQILTYVEENGGSIYKITLVRPRHMEWTEEEVKTLEKEFTKEPVTATGSKIRCFAQEHCLQIVNAKASKTEGVKLICGWLGLSPKDAAAEGDSPEDEGMMELCSSHSRNGVSAAITSIDTGCTDAV